MVAETTRLPVRSVLFKHDTGGLVVKWVTISESLLLYVFDVFDILARGTERASRDVIIQEERKRTFAFCLSACVCVLSKTCAVCLDFKNTSKSVGGVSFHLEKPFHTHS
jgi:hypothetical protein